MANTRTPNHPVQMTNHYEPLAESEPKIIRGNQYGNVNTDSYLQCAGVDPSKTDPIKVREFEVSLTTNTSFSNLLQPGFIYYVTGKLIATNDGKTPMLTYNQASVARIKPVGEDGFQFANKASITGLGLVIKRQEVVAGMETRLEVILEHNDWNSKERRHQKFNVKYVVPGSKNFIKTHALYVVGREVHLMGLLVDFDLATKMAIVLVSDCSITSGHQVGRSTMISPTLKSPHGKGRNLLKFSSREDSSPPISPNVSPAKRSFSHQPSSSGDPQERGLNDTTKADNSDIDDPSGAATPDNTQSLHTVEDQPARGRARKSILRDAAKRMKKL